MNSGLNDSNSEQISTDSLLNLNEMMKVYYLPDLPNPYLIQLNEYSLPYTVKNWQSYEYELSIALQDRFARIDYLALNLDFSRVAIINSISNLSFI